jgi:hypothetical protein
LIDEMLTAQQNIAQMLALSSISSVRRQGVFPRRPS